MKKIFVPFLVVFAMFMFTFHINALPLQLNTGFIGNGAAVATLVVPMSSNYNLRGGLGLSFANGFGTTSATFSLLRMGIEFPQFLGLVLDLDFNYWDMNTENLFDDYSIALKKPFDFKITDQIALSAELTLLKYAMAYTPGLGNYSSFSILSAIEPQIKFSFKL